jgi:hypothetical protein
MTLPYLFCIQNATTCVHAYLYVDSFVLCIIPSFIRSIAAYLRHSVQLSFEAAINIMIDRHPGATDITLFVQVYSPTQHLLSTSKIKTFHSTWNSATSAGYGVVPASWSQPPEIFFNLTAAPSHHRANPRGARLSSPTWVS